MTPQPAAETPIPAELLSDVLWERAGETSLEHFRLSRLASGYTLQGIVLAMPHRTPLQVHYMVACNAQWLSQVASITIIEGDGVRRLALERDGSGAWRRDRNVLEDFEGILDLDLQITPATNTIPIRRLALEIGESAETDALWIRFPELTLERLPQRYTRTGVDSYMYESGNGAFRAQLAIDDQGVVIHYGDIWRRIRD